LLQRLFSTRFLRPFLLAISLNRSTDGGGKRTYICGIMYVETASFPKSACISNRAIMVEKNYVVLRQ
jgi:hypothetical protein